MLLDLKTLLICNAFVSIFIGLFGLVYKKNEQTYPGFTHWVVGNFLIGMGFLMIPVSTVLPVWFNILFINAFFGFGVVFWVDGLVRFSEGGKAGAGWHLLVVFMLAGLELMYFTVNGIKPRIAFLGLVISVILARGGVALWKGKHARKLSFSRGNALICLGFGLLAILRPFIVDNAIYFSCQLLATLAGGICFLLLNNQRMQNDLKRATRAKSRFLATMSHEIRTPLNAIVGMAHLMSQHRLDPAQVKDLAVIRTASGQLLDLINDILDFSKIEAGELSVDPHDFFLPGLLQDLRQLFAVSAETKGLNLDVGALSEGIPKGLYGDGNRLKQMLVNLLSNAIKFTETGGVSLTVTPAQGDVPDGQVLLRFAVKDSGKGIAPEAQAKLFKPFSQEDASTTRRYGGTGLGLSIVHRLAGMMGGRVGVDSEPGRGATFWTELPFKVSKTASVTRRERPREPVLSVSDAKIQEGKWPHLTGVRLLLVDDSDVNLMVTRRILEGKGVVVTCCKSGREAINLLQAAPEGYDLVLMDLQMPEMDGVEAARVIRQQLGLGLPVLALTAGATTEEQKRADEAGMDDFLTKPLDPVQLIGTVARYAGPPVPDAGGESASDEKSPSPACLPVIAGIDNRDVSDLLSDDISLFPMLLDLFLAENAEIVTQVKALLAAGDKDKAAKRVHKIRGQAANIGARPLRLAAADLENTLKADGSDWEAPFQLFSRLHRELVEAAEAWRKNR